jgi:hypothetical protein
MYYVWLTYSFFKGVRRGTKGLFFSEYHFAKKRRKLTDIKANDYLENFHIAYLHFLDLTLNTMQVLEC